MRRRWRGCVRAASETASAEMTASTTSAHVSAATAAVLRECRGGREQQYGCGQSSDEDLCGDRTVWI